MELHTKFKGFTEPESVKAVIDHLKQQRKKQSVDVVLEYYNPNQAVSYIEDPNNEIKPEHMIFLKKLREACNDLDFEVKDLYLLGKNVDITPDELLIITEETKESYPGRNYIWPSKGAFLFEGSKRMLDSLLHNGVIDQEEYDEQLLFIQRNFGMVYDIQDETLLN